MNPLNQREEVASPGQILEATSCGSCGATCKRNAVFCVHCGRRLHAEAARALAPLEPSASAESPRSEPVGDRQEESVPTGEPTGMPSEKPQEDAAYSPSGQQAPDSPQVCSGCGRPIGEDGVRYRLTLTGPQGSPVVIEICKSELTIGADAECNVRVTDDKYVSRRHARIIKSNEMFFLEDTGSSNGTFLRIRRPTVLEDNDEIVVGTSVLRLERIDA